MVKAGELDKVPAPKAKVARLMDLLQFSKSLFQVGNTRLFLHKGTCTVCGLCVDCVWTVCGLCVDCV
jgi:hypothetical protein